MPVVRQVDDRSDFRKRLEELINTHSMENGSDTPDYILANFMTNSLNAFDTAVNERERFYDRQEELDEAVPPDS
jgi:hypothetical protein